MISSLPTVQEICAIVTEELAVGGGTVSDRIEVGNRLFLRSILPLEDEVKRKDIVQGGVAVMADETVIHVRPYLLRQVCRNGAVMPLLVEARSIRRLEPDSSAYDLETVETELREAVRSCSVPEVFSSGIKHFRMATMREADFTMFQLLMHSSLGGRAQTRFQAEIMRRFVQGDDRSVFGLVNAVTSVARDQRDPETRWHLEELGGGMLAMKFPGAKPGGAGIVWERTVEQEEPLPTKPSLAYT